MIKLTSSTPGPWFFQQVGCDRFIVYGAETGTAKVASASGWSMDEMEANARLIAAAPEMLAALKNMVATDELCREDYEEAHAAIAKAEGR